MKKERFNPAHLGVFAVFFLVASCAGLANAGLPPTSSKALGDAAKKTTFNFEFPTHSVSRSGTTSTLYPPDKGPVNLLGLSSAYAPTSTTDRDAEVSVGNWTAYADAAATAPDAAGGMTGGSPNTTIARSTSSPINGAAHFLMTLTTGATRQGEGASALVYIPPAYRGQMLEFSFPFTTTGTITEDDLKLYAYDVTNSLVITPYSAGKILGAGPSKAVAVFPISTTTAQLRVGVHIARASNTGAVTLLFDDVAVSPNPTTYGMAGSDVQSYTPTLGAGFGTTSGSAFFYWRVGDNLFVHGYWINGTVAGSAATVTLPSGLAIDSAKIGPNNTSANPGAMVGHYTTSTGQHGALVTATGTSTSLIYLAHQDGNAGGLTPQNGNTITSNSVSMTVDFVVPIAGWSSNVTMAESSQFKISSYLASGSRVTGAEPDALGEYRSYIRDAGANTFTEEPNGSPGTTPSVANGIQAYNGAAWSSADPNNEPTRYRIFIGKNKSYRMEWYSGVGRTGDISAAPISLTSSLDAGYRVSYDPVTGILDVQAHRYGGGGTTHVSGLSNASLTVNDPFFDVVVSENALNVGVSGSVLSYGPTERVERAKVTCSGSSSIVSQSGTWLSSVGNVSSGTCAYTIAAGIFSGEPACHFQEIAGAGAFYFHTAAATTTSLSIRGVTDSGTNITAATGYLLCMGPR